MGMDDVFRALADPTRRHLLDRLHEDNGQTLGQLCEHLGMRRQSVSQHLDLLEAANLISTVRQGRTKLHYLNPVPLQEMQERWVDKFERPRLRALSTLRRRAETTMDKPSYVYVTYNGATPERVWDALTNADATAPSRVTFTIEPYGDIVRLTVTHEDLANEADRDAVGSGWPAVLSNLKSFLETGSTLPQAPWDMPQPAPTRRV